MSPTAIMVLLRRFFRIGCKNAGSGYRSPWPAWRSVLALLLIASGFGVIPLSVSVVLHEGSTIVVVLNALRLLAWREPAATA